MSTSGEPPKVKDDLEAQRQRKVSRSGVLPNLELSDWRRSVAELYSDVRHGNSPRQAWGHWRAGRDTLFQSHPQSPIPAGERSAFRGLNYFDYDPAMRFALELTPAEPVTHEVSSSNESSYAFTRFATADLDLPGGPFPIEVYWLEGYAGGIFLPFRDAGAGSSTYGGGRYILDTAKGADLGVDQHRLIVDFNFAYQPSCSYNRNWVCPLAPEPNRLPVEINAGEMLQRNG